MTMPRKLSDHLRDVQSSAVADCVRPSGPYHRDSARTLAKWAALESLGLVRLTSEPDPDFDPSDYDCDFDDDDEAFGSIGQFVRPACVANVLDMGADEADESDWITADSCWGHVGYRDVLDWRENVSILDIMSSTVDAFRDAWKDHLHALPGKADGIASHIAFRHEWIDLRSARQMIRADMEIIRDHVGACSEEGLSLRSAIRVASRLFPDDTIPVEIPHCSKSSDRS
jgi:hypothetical protein